MARCAKVQANFRSFSVIAHSKHGMIDQCYCSNHGMIETDLKLCYLLVRVVTFSEIITTFPYEKK